MSGEVFHAPLLQALPEFEISTIVQRNAEKAAKHFPSVKIVRTVDEALTRRCVTHWSSLSS
jgi:scyllo-inositol 2-dehydrogenase (NADP+)